MRKPAAVGPTCVVSGPRVVIPIEDYGIGTNPVDSIYIRSNSDSTPAAPQFYVDDVQLVTATVN